MNKSVGLLASIFIVLGLSGCGTQGIEVPDVVGTDTATAKSVLSSLGLIPVEKLVNSETVDAGNVIQTDPPIGAVSDPGSKIELQISSGPKLLQAKASTIEWQNVAYSMDNWEFSNPTIEDGTLKIEITEANLKAKVKWKDTYNEGAGYGNASINDSFDKAVPLKIIFDKQTYSSGEKQKLTLEVPVSDLENQKPTTIYLELYASVNGVDTAIELTFTMTW